MAKRGVEPADVWELMVVTDPRISPDGRRVAYVVARNDRDTDKAQTSIWVAALDGSTDPRAFTFGESDNSPRWSPDGSALVFAGKRGDDTSPQLYLAPLDGGEPRRLTDEPHGASQPAWSPDGGSLVYVALVGEWKRPEDRDAIEKNAPRVVKTLHHRFDGLGWNDDRRAHLFVLDVGSGKRRQLTDGDCFDGETSWSSDGATIAFTSDRSKTRFDSPRPDVWVVPARGGRARRVTRGEGAAAQPRFSPDGTTIAYVGHENGEQYARSFHVMAVAADGSSPPRSLTEQEDAYALGWGRGPIGRHLDWFPSGDAVVAVIADRGNHQLARVGLDQSVRMLTSGDRQVVAFDANHDANVAAVATVWPSAPYEVVALALAEPKPIARPRAVSRMHRLFTKDRSLAGLKRIVTRTADGVATESFLMRPLDGGDRPAPLVLEVHGGPNGWHPQSVFLPFYQALCAAGYAVLLANPRGSQSYGEKFSMSSLYDWGGGDFDDLMTAVDSVIESGLADAKRLYCAGYSYGGFMTGWIIGHTDRFKAACISAPVSNLSSMFGTTDIPKFSEYNAGGLPWDVPDAYRDGSPITYLPNVRTPVCLFHWEGDLRTPIGQSEEWFQGLRTLGREVELVRYPGGFHVLRQPSQMQDYIERHLAWFDAHR